MGTLCLGRGIPFPNSWARPRRLAIGAVVAWVELRGELEAETRALLVVGVLGSLTTFSAFGDEVMSFAREGRALAASGVVLAHLTLGLGGVVLGRALATWALR